MTKMVSGQWNRAGTKENRAQGTSGQPARVVSHKPDDFSKTSKFDDVSVV